MDSDLRARQNSQITSLIYLQQSQNIMKLPTSSVHFRNQWH